MKSNFNLPPGTLPTDLDEDEMSFDEKWEQMVERDDWKSDVAREDN